MSFVTRTSNIPNTLDVAEVTKFYYSNPSSQDFRILGFRYFNNGFAVFEREFIFKFRNGKLATCLARGKVPLSNSIFYTDKHVYSISARDMREYVEIIPISEAGEPNGTPINA